MASLIVHFIFHIVAGVLAYNAHLPDVLLNDVSPLDESSAKFLKNQLENGLVLNTPQVCQSLGFFCHPAGNLAGQNDNIWIQPSKRHSWGRKFLDAALKSGNGRKGSLDSNAWSQQVPTTKVSEGKPAEGGKQHNEVPITISWGPQDVRNPWGWTEQGEKGPITLTWGYGEEQLWNRWRKPNEQHPVTKHGRGEDVPVTISWGPRDNAIGRSKPGSEVPVTIAWAGPEENSKEEWEMRSEEVPITIGWGPQDNGRSKPGEQVPVTIAWAGPEENAKEEWEMRNEEVPITIGWGPQDNGRSKPGEQVPVTLAWGQPEKNAREEWERRDEQIPVTTSWGPENNGKRRPHQHEHKHKGKAAARVFRLAALHPGNSIPLPEILEKVPNKLIHPLLADSMPFNQESLTQVMKIFSIPPYSRMGSNMGVSVQLGSSVKNDIEIKKAVVSIKEMVEFAGGVLCNSKEDCDLNSIAQSFENKSPTTVRIIDVQKLAEDVVACHTVPFPYEVYVCHKLIKSVLFKVTVKEGGETKALPVMCHMDTSKFRADHPGFKELNMKPGDGEVCHSMEYKTVMWYA